MLNTDNDNTSNTDSSQLAAALAAAALDQVELFPEQESDGLESAPQKKRSGSPCKFGTLSYLEFYGPHPAVVDLLNELDVNVGTPVPSALKVRRAIAALAEGHKPCVVKQRPGMYYSLVGHEILNAAKEQKLTEIPVCVYSYVPDNLRDVVIMDFLNTSRYQLGNLTGIFAESIEGLMIDYPEMFRSHTRADVKEMVKTDPRTWGDKAADKQTEDWKESKRKKRKSNAKGEKQTKTKREKQSEEPREEKSGNNTTEPDPEGLSG